MGGGRQSGVKFRSGRRERWGEGVLRFGFTSHCPTLICLVINSIPFPNLGLFCPREKLLCDLPILILTHKPFVTFSLPCPVEASVGAWHPARANPSQAAELGRH